MDKADKDHWSAHVSEFQTIDLLDDFITVIDRNRNILKVNKSLQSRLKYSEDEIINKPVNFLFNVFSEKEIEALFNSVMKGEKTYCHIPLVTKNKTLVQVETNFKRVETSAGVNVFLISREISKLALGNEIFSTIFKTNPSLMCIMSLKDRKVVEVNDAFLSVLEFDRKDVVGKEFRTLELAFDPEEYKRFQKMIYANTSLKNVEVEAKTRSGLTKYGNLSTELIYIEEEPCLLMVLADITEFKNYQLKLKRSERKYRDLTEMLPEMICEVDLDGMLLYANQFAIRKFGYNNGDIVFGEFSIFNIFEDSEKTKAKQSFFRSVVSGQQSANEYVVKRKDGSTFPVIVYASPMMENDILKGIRGVMVDISERKASENLIKQNLRYQEIISGVSLELNAVKGFQDRINSALQIIGNYTLFNQIYIYKNNCEDGVAYLKFSWTEEEKAGLVVNNEFNYARVPYWEKWLIEKGVITTKENDKLPTEVHDYFKQRNVEIGVVLPLKIDDCLIGFIGFEGVAKAFDVDDAKFDFLQVISRIISNEFEKNKTEEELITSEKENRAIIDSIPDIIFRFDKEGRVISVKSAQKDIPFAPKEIVKQEHVDNIFHTELARKMLVAINVCLVSGTFEFDFTVENEKQALRFYEARFQKMSDYEVLVIVRDVTQIKEHEKELQEARKIAEDASRAKSEFLANVSHEIRTPMNAILGFSEVLVEKIDHPQYSNYLETILSSGRTLLTLINDILDLSKIEAGKLEVNIEPVQFRLLMKEMIQVFQHKASQKNLALDYQVDEGIPQLIYIDEVRLHQIIFNLVGNAIKYTEKGYVKVNCRAEPTTLLDEIVLFIEVEDTGIGIPEEQQKMIFEAFTQQSGQNNRKFEGTGLGLAIAQKLVKMLNGKIHLKSKAGFGSTFTVELNRIKVADIQHVDISPIKETESLNIEFEPAKVMIVDDIEYNIMIFKTMVDFESISFIEADSGEQALEVLKTQIPDMIFMDLKMYGLSGYGTTEIIKKDPRLKHIPVVAFTASAMEEEIVQIKELFDGFLRKPASRKQIYDELKNFLPYYEIADADMKVETKKEVKEVLTESVIKEIAEMLSILKEEFVPKWEDVKDDLIMFELETFADELFQMIKGYPCLKIKEYHTKLDDSLKSFDIEEIERYVADFPEVLAKIESEINQ